MNVQQLRNILPVTNDTIYMNNRSAGPTPQTVIKRISETLEQEACLGPTSNKVQAHLPSGILILCR